MARRVNRRRGRGSWIPQLAHDIGLALIGFAYLLALIAIMAFMGDAMGALAAVLALPISRGSLIESIARRFRADMAVAAGIPEDDPPPSLAETLATLNDLQARVNRMIAAAPPRPWNARTRADDLPLYADAAPVPASPEPMA